ncbi:MAG: hypothetical protein JWO73_424 [Candidatus Taylorbacteria bacterium]|nr:hypothetical protein [Candidatus Taylorbacteria bacterium]
MKKITILTRRASVKDFFAKGVRNALRFVRKFLKTGIIDFDMFIYYGHTAVTKSLIEGLREMGAEFDFNPLSAASIGGTVLVLSDVGALKQAIDLKKNGKIATLLAGPNLVELPTERDSILSSPEIDTVIVPSKMTADIYEKLNPALIGRIAVWYAGVDTDYWSPANPPKEKEILVYWKNAPKAFCLEAELILKKEGYKINRVTYGHYSKAEFRKLLRQSACAVFLSITETQGIALAEAWAANTPTVVWDPEIEHYYIRGVKTTSAPYLSKECGVRWKELSELKRLFSGKAFDPKAYSPREWVLENMSNRISAEMLVAISENPNKKTI